MLLRVVRLIANDKIKRKKKLRKTSSSPLTIAIKISFYCAPPRGVTETRAREEYIVGPHNIIETIVGHSK